MAKRDPARAEDERENGSANQNGLKDGVSLIVRVAHAVRQRRKEGKTAPEHERETTEAGAEPTSRRCWFRARRGPDGFGLVELTEHRVNGNPSGRRDQLVMTLADGFNGLPLSRGALCRDFLPDFGERKRAAKFIGSRLSDVVVHRLIQKRHGDSSRGDPGATKLLIRGARAALPGDGYDAKSNVVGPALRLIALPEG